MISEAKNCDSFLAPAAFPVDNDPVGDNDNNDATGVSLIMLLVTNPLYACQRLLMVSHKCRYFDGRGANSNGTDARLPSFSINRFDCKLSIAAFTAETFEELRTFVHGERGKMGGLPGKNDDRVMALSLANMAGKQQGIGDIVLL